MIAPINFELAKLLKEKGFDKKVKPFYNALVNNQLVESDIIGFDNNLPDWYPAPTIVEIVIWLYEKHEIWIWVEKNTNNLFTAWVKTNIPYTMPDTNSPTEAYEAAIEYVLLNLI